MCEWEKKEKFLTTGSLKNARISVKTTYFLFLGSLSLFLDDPTYKNPALFSASYILFMGSVKKTKAKGGQVLTLGTNGSLTKSPTQNVLLIYLARIQRTRAGLDWIIM